MKSYGYTLTEHDPAKPWLITGTEHRSVDLADSEDFFSWATAQWPTGRFTVELDPWALSERSKP